MDYLIGGKRQFFDFLDLISSDDKIGVLTHVDLDGVASAIFLEEILRSRGIKVEVIYFIQYGAEILTEKLNQMKEKGISKIFILDLNLEETKEFSEAQKFFNILEIDHHPFSADFMGKKNIIKTESSDCTAWTLYDIGNGILNKEKWDWLVCSTMVAEYSFNKKENLKFIKKYYPDFQNMNSESELGSLTKKLSFSLIYFKEKNDIGLFYEIIKNKNFEKLEKGYSAVKKEIQKYLNIFEKKAEFFSEKNLCFFYGNPNFSVSSVVTSILLSKNPDKTFIFVSDSSKKNFYKISAKSKIADMNVLLKKSVSGLEDSTAGGHPNASGGFIKREDLDNFKHNLLRNA
ncbi:MAG: DHH family phosphoesterase [archaeon]